MDPLTSDTMDQLATKEALRESRESFKALAENANDGVLIAVGGGVHVYANRRASEITGYSIAELLKTSIEDLAAPDEIKNLMEKFRKRISGKNIPNQYETVIIHKDGRSVPIEITAAKTIWHGQPAIIVIIRDITELKRMEVELKERETKLCQLVDNTTDWVWTIDLEGCYTYSNPAIYNLLGYRTNEIIGTTTFPLIHPYDEPFVRDMLKQCIDLKVGWHNVPIRWLHKDGSVHLFESSASPLVNAEEQITGFSGIDRDITERKKAENALRESEAKFRLIADNTADSIWIFDMDMHLQYISPSVKKMKGFTVEETLSQSLEEMMTPSSLESLMKRFQLEMELEASGTADPDRAVSFETEEYCKDGSTILVENSVTLIRDAQGRPVLMQGISRDITSRKRTEERLVHLASFPELNPVLILEADQHGSILYANPALMKATEAIGESDPRIFIPQDIRDRLNGTVIAAPEHEIREIEVHGQAFRENIYFTPEFSSLRVYATNITERKRMEEALQESQKRFQELTETTNDFVWEMDANGAYTYCSPQIKELWGYKPEDMIGRTPFDVMLPEDKEHAIKMFSTLLESPTTFKGMETSSWDSTGKIVVLETSGVPFFDINGKLCGYRGMSRDITRRKWAEKALQIQYNLALELTTCHTSKEALELILDAALLAEGVDSGGIYMADPVNGALDIVAHRGLSFGFVEHTSHFDADNPQLLRAKSGTPFYGQYADVRLPGKDEIRDREGITALASIPVLHDGNLIAIMNIASHVHDDIPIHTRHLLETMVVPISGALIYIRSEEALQESEARLSLAMEVGNAGVWQWNLDNDEVYFDARFHALLGYNPGELPTTLKEWMPYYNQEDVPVWMGKAKAYLRGDSPFYESEHRIRTKAGDWAWVFTRGQLMIRTRTGSPKMFIGFAMNITEPKRLEEALRETSAQLTFALHSAKSGAWHWDFPTGKLEWYPEFFLLFGLPPDAPPSFETWLATLHPDDRTQAMEKINQSVKDHKDLWNEYRIRIPGGDWRWIGAAGRTSYNDAGEAVRMSGICIDITDRKQAEEALRESEERYRIITDAAHDAIYTLSPEGVVTFANSGGSALIGLPPEKIVGLSLESLFHPDIAQALRQNLEKVISTKSPVRFDEKFQHEDSEQVTWLDSQLVPHVGPDGSVVQVIVISRSITDRKQAELLLKRFNLELESQVRSRTIELEHVNVILGTEVIQRTLAEESLQNSLNEREFLLREIHHRVKNNLQIILSLINLQSRNIKDPDLLDTLGNFKNRIVAMAHVHERMCLVDDISRIDLSEIVTFLGTSLFRSYEVDHQRIRLNVKINDIHISINTAIPLCLIINELITNSIKHAFPKGTPGEITIKVHPGEADTLVLSVRDTGIGMPEDYDWMRSNQSLGHRLVVNLVKQLDGTVELDRTTGTAFNIVIKEKNEADSFF
jgi:PAS domain S-box-containing protein